MSWYTFFLFKGNAYQLGPLTVIVLITSFSIGNITFYSGTPEMIMNRVLNLGTCIKIIGGLISAAMVAFFIWNVYFTYLVFSEPSYGSHDYGPLIAFGLWIFFISQFVFMYLQSLLFMIYVSKYENLLKQMPMIPMYAPYDQNY